MSIITTFLENPRKLNAIIVSILKEKIFEFLTEEAMDEMPEDVLMECDDINDETCMYALTLHLARAKRYHSMINTDWLLF
jgi:hypothetical protein